MCFESMTGNPSFVVAKEVRVPRQQDVGFAAHIEATLLPKRGEPIRGVTAPQEKMNRSQSAMFPHHLRKSRRGVFDLPFQALDTCQHVPMKCFVSSNAHVNDRSVVHEFLVKSCHPIRLTTANVPS